MHVLGPGLLGDLVARGFQGVVHGLSEGEGDLVRSLAHSFGGAIEVLEVELDHSDSAVPEIGMKAGWMILFSARSSSQRLASP